MKIIARIHSDFPDKFGIPRQSGLVDALRAQIVFEPEFRDANAVRGLENFSHIWLIWEFSEAKRERWSATVRPPRLGGNVHMGVFASRSPFRPNPLGLSCVRLKRVEMDAELGPVLDVQGADLMDGTPIFDIKPYLPYADAHPDARSSFGPVTEDDLLELEFSEALLGLVPDGKRAALLEVLAHDPRPAYIEDSERIYGLRFAGCNVRFKVAGRVLTLVEVEAWDEV